MKDILAKIVEYDDIVIHRHKNPDPDALGSQLGLRAILRANFPNKTIAAVGFDEPSLGFLGSMDQLSDTDFKGKLVIVTDTANTPRIDDERYQTGEFLIKIDHHPNDDAYGDLLAVDTGASSASEIIANFAFDNGLSVNDEAARLLYAGIVGDTGRFLYPATTAKTLYTAAKLAEASFDRSGLMREMDSFDMKIARLQGYVYENLEISSQGVARIFITQALMKKHGITDSETSAIVSAPGKIREIQTWAIFVEQADGHYRVRMRSKEAKINEIAKLHAGGGHPLASGANSYSTAENDEIFQQLINNLVAFKK
ncbi:MAG: bifunctional oligoribonuclease/PAP phosphatase NrnA [Lactococcus sp.]|uniref:Bifunctional oligoribonuclease and PAP phosphatase NrnA n=2 Tax=Pseudolactococcus TaxID=3436058 RepID=A0A0D6DX96_9LACT|nr:MULTISPECIES: bifunctional oligoribonuclease/PAP phosphatase NrnA [Lactococcus]SOB47938.1 oligoribonuclease (nanoRNAse), 3',5'-bisphosphate nucleotidase [Lactococcus piscium]MCJ1970889.1 bifunctional oligoribonuclease/PAP phosphatase NrnA [Lactococcus carnosus]MCJ1979184.1 bifunctional oligoribonuclease/PAP phosphatase NrnA [Lactococcus carnosus]MCJ1988812.1 bifunctional oligoribonuclease/PAP phosphatase NrnA [Lactococcus carnosus]MCJ2001573.1 bifunctional oligoribonuclease/PAP phosphatase 